MLLIERFKAYGHNNVSATHRTTLEITREEHLTPRGNCIVAVKSEKGVAGLGEDVKKALKQRHAKVSLILKVLELEDVVTGLGDERLMLTSTLAIICRKSQFVCPKTLMIKCDKSAADINRELVELLRRGHQVEVTIEVVA
ncbi:MAG: DUF371 domain-containing protein [Candidatus Nezhaarchaeota archaeon]|nr:DUF371 domain-containing protein [Candidatus Nezhaarchaeota archaeon]